MKSSFIRVLSLVVILTMILPGNSPAVAQPTNPMIGYSISGRVTDGSDNGLAGVTINAMPSECSSATGRPVLLVTGWGGSVGKTKIGQDENFRELIPLFEQHGYIEGCNLFYASGTTPTQKLADNAVIIQDQICKAQASYKTNYAEKLTPFNIIAHSYGGLRARSFLEGQLYGASCPISTGGTDPVKVDNLITLGTPHGGEIGDLPLSSLIRDLALYSTLSGNENNTPAIWEMLPPVRLWQNLTSSQPNGVDYYIVSGDARLQALSFSPVFGFMFLTWPHTTRIDPSDMAVHRLSSFALALFPGMYPRLNLISTQDVHGRCDESDPNSTNGKACVALGINSLNS